MVRSFSWVGAAICALACGATACAAPAAEETGGTSSADKTGCRTMNGYDVCGSFLTTFERYGGPGPRVGLPLTRAFTYAGDRFQVFERVVMNDSLAHPCGTNVACVSLIGRDDAVDTLGKPFTPTPTSCDDDAVAPRGYECLANVGGDADAARFMRDEVSSKGNAAYYGLLLTRVLPTCAWWNYGPAPQHYDCYPDCGGFPSALRPSQPDFACCDRRGCQ